MFSEGILSLSRVCTNKPRLRMLGVSSVVTANSKSDRSNAASTTSVSAAGVSTMTMSKHAMATSITLPTSEGAILSAWEGSRGAASTQAPVSWRTRYSSKWAASSPGSSPGRSSTSAMVKCGFSWRAVETSPNCRSRSRMQVLRPCPAKKQARLLARNVLPQPPVADAMVMTVPIVPALAGPAS